MKVGIISLPLHANYGGILQAFALKSVVESLGHEVTFFDQKNKTWFPPLWKAPFIYAKRSIFRLFKGKQGPEVFKEYRLRKEYPIISSRLTPFINDKISPLVLNDFSSINVSDYEAFIVGSDQVWRPRYFCGSIEDAFLAFAQGNNVKRISYAASFGTDELEYDFTQLQKCSELLSRFDAVSVRENTAVKMCSDWFDCDRAIHVADPVLLLSRSDYSTIASRSANRPCRGKILSYLLDKSESKQAIVNKVSSWTSSSIYDASVSAVNRNLPLEDRVMSSMEEWLSYFEDAEFVVTDSFHGCVLSMIFHKPFLVIGNPHRGMARFHSLLEITGLQSHLIQGIDPDDDGEYWMQPIDWKYVEERLSVFKNQSIDFLRNALR